MICRICKKEAGTLRSGVKNGRYLTDRCEDCFDSNIAFADYARKYNRDRQREDYRKDILQRWDGDKPDKDFVRAYPEKSRELWDNETLRKYI